MISNEISQAFCKIICYNFSIMKIFAERLRDLRTERGLSQRELAKLVNLSCSAIQQWESETRVPNAEAIVAIAKFFSVSSDYLLGLSN